MLASKLSFGIVNRQKITDWLKQNRLGIVLLPLLCSAICVFVEKFLILIKINAFALIAADTNLRNPHPLTLLQKIGIFRADLFWGMVLVPAVFCTLTFWLAPRWRIMLAVLVSFFIQVIIIVETLSMLTTGAFSSLSMIWFAAWWAMKTRDTSLYYHPLATGLLSAADLGFALLFGIIALVALRKNSRLLNHFVLSTFAVGALVTAVAYIPRVPAMPWSEPILQMTAGPALFSGDVFPNISSRSLPELMQTYREQEHAPAPGPTAYTGKAKNYNVVIIVLESMTAQAFDPAHDSLSDMPNVRRLRDQSFLMGRHYTTYPTTDNATFGIYTSIYAYLLRAIVPRPVVLPGMIRTLRNDGYATGFYGFIWNIPEHRDYNLPLSLGFEKISAPSTMGNDAGNAVFTGPTSYVIKFDHDALLNMLSDIHNWTGQGRRFAVGFSPEIGHDPYRSLDGNESETSLQRGHALAVYQDAWLGELLDELQHDKVLDQTIIAITGDHGMRSEHALGTRSSGDIHVLHGALDDVVMRVPMLIYAPGVLHQAKLVETPTSHIDIMPTVLDLLGISSGKDAEQGSPVYTSGLERRRVFLSMSYLGASGYYEGGEYYSRSSLGNGIVYKNSTLNFDSSDMLPFDSEEADHVRKIIDIHEHNQALILNHVFTGK